MIVIAAFVTVVGANALKPVDPHHLVEVRWREVPAERLATVRVDTAEGKRRALTLVDVSRSVPLRLECPEGVKPRRYWATADALIEGEFSEPIKSDEDWIFAAVPFGGPWALAAPGCKIDEWRRRLLAMGFDRMERQPDEVGGLPALVDEADPFTSEETAWLAGAPAGSEEWVNRYRLLRPPVAGLRNSLRIAPQGSVAADAFRYPDWGEEPSDDTAEWFAKEPVFEVLVEGTSRRVDVPARVVVNARRVGDSPDLCLTIDGGAPLCQTVSNQTRLTARDGGLIDTPLRRGTADISRRVSWRILLPAGRHTLKLSAPAYAVAHVGELTGISRDLGPPPVTPVVYPPSVLATPAGVPLTTTVTVPARGASVGSVGLMIPSSSAVLDADLGSWLSVDAAHSSDVPFIDAEGYATLWFPDPKSKCTVELPGSGEGAARFEAQPTSPTNRFLWTGSAGAMSGWPSVLGCRAWVRSAPRQAAAAPVTAPSSGSAYVLTPFQSVTGDATAAYALEPDAETSGLWVAWLPGQALPFTITIATDLGTTRLALTPLVQLAGAALVPSSSGEAYRAPIRLSLPAAIRTLSVQASIPMATRARQTVSSDPALAFAHGSAPGGRAASASNSSVAAGATAHERAAATATDGYLAALRRLSRELAAAETPVDRARILAERATLLEAAGFENLALSDDRWSRAIMSQLGMPIPPSEPRISAIRVLADVLFGPDRWVPVSPAWVRLPDTTRATSSNPAPPPVAGRGFDASHRPGDYLQRAGDALTDPAERLRAWRSAILGGQVLTSDERLTAYIDLVEFGSAEQTKHPSFWPIRAVSRWQTIYRVTGAVRPSNEVFDVSPPPGPKTAVTDALFPDVWPRAEVISIRGGAELEIPARSGARELGIRCRATRLETSMDSCAFRVTDSTDREVVTVAASPFGIPTVLPIPDSPVPLYVSAKPVHGAVCQMRLPAELAAARNREKPQRIWRIGGGHTAAIDVLGPTVVRIREQSRKPLAVSAIIRSLDPTSDQAPVTTHFDVGAQAEFELPVRLQGPVRIELTPSAEMGFVASMRVPLDRALDPVADNREIAAALTGSDEGQGDAPLAGIDIGGMGMPEPPRGGRPEQTPGITFVPGAFGGAEPVFDEPEQDTKVSAIVAAGVTARVDPYPVWWSAGFQAFFAGDQTPVYQLQGGVEWVALRERWWVDTMGDIYFAYGDPGGKGMFTTKGRVRGRVGYWFLPRFLGRFSASYFDRGVNAGAERGEAGYGNQPVLWSDYQEGHRRGLCGAVEGRGVAERWLWFTVIGGVCSNEDIVGTPDFASATFRVDYGQPDWWVRAGFNIQRRFDDGGRDEAFWSPNIFLRGWYTLWLDGNVALQPVAEGLYQAHFASFSFLAGLRLYISEDRGLSDVRPSRMIYKDAASWTQDSAADQTYGVEDR